MLTPLVFRALAVPTSCREMREPVRIWPPRPLLASIPQILAWRNSPTETGMWEWQVAVAERVEWYTGCHRERIPLLLVQDSGPSKMTPQCVFESPGRTHVPLAPVHVCRCCPSQKSAVSHSPRTAVLHCLLSQESPETTAASCSAAWWERMSFFCLSYASFFFVESFPPGPQTWNLGERARRQNRAIDMTLDSATLLFSDGQSFVPYSSSISMSFFLSHLGVPHGLECQATILPDISLLFERQ